MDTKEKLADVLSKLCYKTEKVKLDYILALIEKYVKERIEKLDLIELIEMYGDDLYDKGYSVGYDDAKNKK